MGPTEPDRGAAGTVASRSLRHMREHGENFCCPLCGGPLGIGDERIECRRCRRHFQHDGGIPLMFAVDGRDVVTDEVTDCVKSFYEHNPFPNYDEVEDVGTLIQKANAGLFARWLNDQIPFNVKILEVGCGTGQLSNFLGVSQRIVFGTDMSLSSLRLAQRFRDENALARVGFYQMNLFKPIFRPESFDLVICDGVLHHTAEPFRGFQTISRLVKPGGYILIGLYNRYGRFPTDVRRWVFRLTGDRMKFLDRFWRETDRGLSVRWTWYLDQYRNPHESKHTYGEALRWFDQTGFTFISSLPRIAPFPRNPGEDGMFTPQRRGTRLDRGLLQARLLFSGKEGGFFLMLGRRSSAGPTPAVGGGS